MRVWRVTAFALAMLAFVLAAACPDELRLFGATPTAGLRLGRMTFFWIGVVFTLAAAWGRGT